MTNLERIKDMLDAINSVKFRLRKAFDAKDYIAISQLTGDLFALESCLVIECEMLVDTSQVTQLRKVA